MPFTTRTCNYKSSSTNQSCMCRIQKRLLKVPETYPMVKLQVIFPSWIGERKPLPCNLQTQICKNISHKKLKQKSKTHLWPDIYNMWTFSLSDCAFRFSWFTSMAGIKGANPPVRAYTYSITSNNSNAIQFLRILEKEFKEPCTNLARDAIRFSLRFFGRLGLLLLYRQCMLRQS